VVVEYIRYAIPPERSDEFQAAYAQAQGALASSDHCRGWELSQGVEEPQNFILRIEWDSVEGHEHGFRASPEFRDFFTAVRPFFDDIQEMKHYRITDVVGAPS
jgi:heme-degrading monooxygenase HmoA